MKQLLIFPFNGNGREAVSVVEAINAHEPRWNVLGFVDDDVGKRGESWGEERYSVLGGREVFSEYPEASIIAVPGRPENFHRRAEIIGSLGVAPERYATLVHPRASLGVGSVLGRNVLVMANVVMTASVTIGDHVVILPNTVLSHDSAVGSYCMVGSNVSISGSVNLGTGCYVGSGAKVIHEVQIGTGSLVGLGSVVIEAVPDRAIVVGNPARRLRRVGA